MYPQAQRMAYAEQTTRRRGRVNEHASALAYEWRRLTRVATCVALLTSPAFFLVLYDSDHLGLAASLIVTAIGVIAFRGLIEVGTRKLLPWPSLFGAEDTLKEHDLVARRRYWYWRGKFPPIPGLIAFILLLLVFCRLLFAFSRVRGW